MCNQDNSNVLCDTRNSNGSLMISRPAPIITQKKKQHILKMTMQKETIEKRYRQQLNSARRANIMTVITYTKLLRGNIRLYGYFV